jgi:hypothetical protein
MGIGFDFETSQFCNDISLYFWLEIFHITAKFDFTAKVEVET